MEFFLQNFPIEALFGSTLFFGVNWDLIFMSMAPLILMIVGIGTIFGCLAMGMKYHDISQAKTSREIRLTKKKWETIGRPRRRIRVDAHVGFEGVGVGFEHDDRRG